MQFNYQTRTKEGLVQIGIIEASSKKEAVALLQQEGLYVTYLEKAESESFYFRQIEFFTKARRKDIMMFCRELSLMLKSGVGLVESLKSLALQTTKDKFRNQILKIAADVEGGVYFSEALAKFPKVFSNFLNKIKSGMTYPVFVLLVFVGIGAMGIFIVLPSFNETLNSLQVEIPLITKIVLGIGDFVRVWWWTILLGLAAITIFFWCYIKTEEGKDLVGRTSLKIPLIGSLVKKIQLTRFTENLSTLILAGLPITQALEIVSKVTGNKVYQRIILEAQEGVRRGEPMSAILEKKSEYVPALVTQMIRVGERTGRLDESLLNVANFYESEVNRRIDSLVEIIEPILIIVLGGLVAGLMISIIMPVYKGMSSFGI